MWPLPISGGSAGNCDVLPEEVLSQEHRNGLASEERHVRTRHNALSRPTNVREKVDRAVPSDENNQSPHSIGGLHLSDPKNTAIRCP